MSPVYAEKHGTQTYGSKLSKCTRFFVKFKGFLSNNLKFVCSQKNILETDNLLAIFIILL